MLASWPAGCVSCLSPGGTCGRSALLLRLLAPCCWPGPRRVFLRGCDTEDMVLEVTTLVTGHYIGHYIGHTVSVVPATLPMVH